MSGAELVKVIEENNLKDALLDTSVMSDEVAFLEHDWEHDIYKETIVDVITGKVDSVTYF